MAAAVAPGLARDRDGRGVLDGPQGDALCAQSPFGLVATDAPLWAIGTVLDLIGACCLC